MVGQALGEVSIGRRCKALLDQLVEPVEGAFAVRPGSSDQAELVPPAMVGFVTLLQERREQIGKPIRSQHSPFECVEDDPV